jgi:hypothetical protein
MATTPLYLGVWNCLTQISSEEAAHQYQLLKDVGSERRFDDKVYAFYSRLIGLYPEVETLSEEELDDSPWACSMEVSGSHVIMAILREQSERSSRRFWRSPKRMDWYVSIPRLATFTCLHT